MKTRKLNRDSNSRAALFKGLAASIIDKEEIKTTSAKARAVRPIIEGMISKAVAGTLHARRMVQADIQDATLVKKLFAEIAPRFAAVKGGFTKITFIGRRKGDNAMIVKLALTKKKEVAAHPSKAAKVAPVEDKPKAAPSTPKVAAPRVAKPTQANKMGANKAGMVRKTGER